MRAGLVCPTLSRGDARSGRGKGTHLRRLFSLHGISPVNALAAAD